MFWKNKPAQPVAMTEQVPMSVTKVDSQPTPPKTAIIQYQILTDDTLYNATCEEGYLDSFNERMAAEVLSSKSHHLIDNHMIILKHCVNRINITKIVKE